MADWDGEWPLVEAAAIDLLIAGTDFDWEAAGGHSIEQRLPVGVVEQGGGGPASPTEQSIDIELTVFSPAAAGRPALWGRCRQVVDVMTQLPAGQPGPAFFDSAEQIFGFRIDPDRGTSGYLVASSTWSVTVRPQG